MTGGIRNFMAQKKQRKQLTLIDSKNRFTYCFQPIQRIQPNYMTDSSGTFMHTKYNWNNPKVRTFSLMLQRQRIPLKTLTDRMGGFIHTKQTNKHTNTIRTTKTTTSTYVSLVTQSLCSYNWDNANSVIFVFKIRNKPTTQRTRSYVYLVHHNNLYLSC